MTDMDRISEAIISGDIVNIRKLTADLLENGNRAEYIFSEGPVVPLVF